MHLILQEFSIGLYPLIYFKNVLFCSKMSSEWLEIYESFVHALVHIRLRFWKLYSISFDFHQSDDQQIILEFCLHRLTHECQYDIFCSYIVVFFHRGVSCLPAALLFKELQYLLNFNFHDFLTANFVRQGYRYHKLRKAFSKFYCRHFELVEKYHFQSEKLMQQGSSNPKFCGDLVYKF